jgi:iron complex transport system substrate-binding protein
VRWSIALLLLPLLGCRAAPSAGSGDGPRVVSLHDVTTEVAVALGGVRRLVGVADPVELPAPVVAAVAGIARADGPESILALRPTVVLGMAVVARQSPELVRFLRGKGIEVWLGQPHSFDDVLALVGEVGARLGRDQGARALAAALSARVGAAPPARGAPLRVFVYDCCDPAFTAGGGAVLSDLIRRAGGRNVFADVASDWTKVAWEEVIARRPELIVIHDYQLDGQGDVASKRARLASIRALAAVPVTVMPLGFSLGGVRSADGVEHLRRAIAAGRKAG